MTSRLVGAGSGKAGRLGLAAVTAVALYAGLMGFLVVALYLEDHSINLPLLVLFAAGVGVAALLALTVSRWAAWLAVLYSVVTTIADAPHQLAELANPTGHAPVSAFILLVGVAAILLSLSLALKARPEAAAAAG